MAFNKEKVMDAARKYVDKGQIDKAVKEYLRIVQEDPKDVRVWLKIGDLYAKKGTKQEATDAYLKVARFYHDQGFFLKAVAVYKQVLKLDPRLVAVILRLAELYQQLGLTSDAVQHYEGVAAHFLRDGNTKAALDAVKKLVELDPENIATRIKLAELYSKDGLVEEASAQFTYACDQLRRQDRQDDFLKVAERLLWHKPDNLPLNRELAGLYLRRNDPRRALQKLQVCYKADKRDVETLGLLALAFQALDQKAKTVSVLKELARIHLENKARDAAADVYRKILEIVPHDQDAQQFLGAQPQQLRPSTFGGPRSPAPAQAAMRAATDFGITADLPPATSSTMGSMPLVDDQGLSGNDFALPDYDEVDVSDHLEPSRERRYVSAAGERHAEEISKILAETDVYVKYGLHHKAIEHLQRVFRLDSENVEAHERLKDILVSQGREQEAEDELLKLAELVASRDPSRAEQYLQEVLAINGTNSRAFALARKFRLGVARMSSEVSYGGGGVAEVDDSAVSASLRTGRTRPARDSIDDFDPNDLIGGIAHGSPAPGRPPQPPPYLAAPPNPWSDTASSSNARTRRASARDVAAVASLEVSDDLPFDRDAARAFDAGMTGREPNAFASGYERTDLDLGNRARDLGDGDGLVVAGSYDPYAVDAYSEASSTNAELSANPALAHSLVEDELEEAEFYVGREMYSEAIESLHTLLARYPDHPLILTKLADVQAMEHANVGMSAAVDPSASVPSVPTTIPAALDAGTDVLDSDDLEEVPDSEFDEASKPSVMLEKPVEEGDANTHYDLGLAYKEMGLYGEAIKAFNKVLRAKTRDAQCRVMIGLCQREQGNAAEAIHEFKQGLHANPTERERLSLYYEIGISYDAMGDGGEALYYLEAVLKRDPSFADTAARIHTLRMKGGTATSAHDDDL